MTTDTLTWDEVKDVLIEAITEELGLGGPDEVVPQARLVADLQRFDDECGWLEFGTLLLRIEDAIWELLGVEISIEELTDLPPIEEITVGDLFDAVARKLNIVPPSASAA